MDNPAFKLCLIAGFLPLDCFPMLVYLIEVISDADERQQQVAGNSSFGYELPRCKVVSKEANKLLVQSIPACHEESKI